MGAAVTDRAPPAGYSLLQIVLHWTIAALVLIQLLFNEPMQEAFDDRMDRDATDAMAGAIVHVVVGMAVLILAIVRLSVRVNRGTPAVPEGKPAIFNWIGYVTHLLLYGFIFAMPITGAVAWFGGVEFSAELHEIGRLILIPTIGLHVLGALAEHFVFRNDGLVRMLRPDVAARKEPS